MASQPLSPRIARHSWGRLELDDGRGFRDAKLFPGGAREWDWSETGTSHSPGVQPADVAELVEQGASVVVLSGGRNRRLAVTPETLAWLKHKGVMVHVLETAAAIELYNDLGRDQAVGGLFHSTC